MTRAPKALALARGDVRDGVASIEHFLQVLGSRRVGPRVLARGLPEVLAGCAPLRAALEALALALRAELAAARVTMGAPPPYPGGIEATKALIAHAEARVDELASALRAHQGISSLDARERLALESTVRRVASDLSAFVRLVDLLGAAVTSETTTIDLGDALAQRRARPPAGATPILLAVDVRVPELTVGDARLVLELLELAVATILRAGVTSPRVVVDLGPEGFPVLTVDEGSGGDGQILNVVQRDELPGEADVIRAAARHAGLTVTFAEDRRRVTIAL